MELEASPSQSQPLDQTPKSGTASPFLANLPSRGLFSSTVVSSNPGGMRVYICDRDTAPPDNQEIKTNQLNILIRSLMIKRQKAESTSKEGKAVAAPEGSRKRGAERVSSDSRASAKRANNQSSRPEGSSGRAAERRDFQGLTVERLRALLKERGLSPKGKKDELIARLKAANG